MPKSVESIDHHRWSPAPLRSLVVSLSAHAGLAAVLWALAYGTVTSPSIRLTALPSAADRDVPLELAAASQARIAEPELAPLAPTDPGLSTESLLFGALRQDAISQSMQSDVAPASIEFFGTRAYGNRFVLVLDISFSMNARGGERFRRACDELLRTVSALQPGQCYCVLLFSWNTERMFYDPAVGYVQVVPGHEERLCHWIRNISMGGGTDPRRALALARQLHPDAVFLLSDGQFNQPTTPISDSGWMDQAGQPFQADVQTGVELLFARLPVHTIAFENPFTRSAMEEISEATGGSCRYVPTDCHQPVDAQRFLAALRHIDQKHRHDARPRDEYMTRLSYARELICEGELAYAEYLVRPLRGAHESMIANPLLLSQVLKVLESELGSQRLEDFRQPPELSELLWQDSSSILRRTSD